MKRTFFGLMCTLLFLLFSFGVRAIDDDSLVLYFSFDDDTKDVEDLSGNGNDGTGVDADNDSDPVSEEVLSYADYSEYVNYSVTTAARRMFIVN